MRESAAPARLALACGTAALLAGRVTEALVSLRRAVELAPAHREARFNLAVALRTHGVRDEALRHARAALALDRSSPSAHVLVGSLVHLAGDVEGALHHHRQAVAVDPECPSAHYALGATLLGLDRTAEGTAHLRAAIAPGMRALPALVQERIRGMLHDAATRTAREPASIATDVDLCAAPLLTEVLVDGPASPPATAAPERGPSQHAAGGSELSLDEAATLLARARCVVALTGAGISRGSGLRTRKELWRTYSRDDAVSIWRFQEDPRYLWSVVRDFLGDHEHVPNAAHHALAALPSLAAVLTQNVDDLHQRADVERASSRPEMDTTERRPVVELHGTLERTRCHGCGAGGARSHDYVGGDAPLPPRCPRCGDALRPDVVLFGEHVAPDRLAEAIAWAERCDVMLVVGCAMDVAPASELPRLAAARGAYVLEVNPTVSRITSALGGGIRRGAAEEVLPALLTSVHAIREARVVGPSARSAAP